MVITAMVALLVWAGAVARSGVGAEDANAGANSAVIHDDLWNPPRSNAGSAAVIHDDAGNMHSDQGAPSSYVY